MRSVLFAVVATLAISIPAIGTAAAPTPVDDIVKALKDEDNRAAPAERGFDFMAPGKPAPPAARGKSVAAPVAPAGRRATPRRSIDMRLEFAMASATLSETARAEARQFAAALKRPELAARRFIVEGHTDAVGNRAYNADLSARRAQAVVDLLVAEGVEPSRLQPAGYGYDRLRFPSRPRDPANRRVEVARLG